MRIEIERSILDILPDFQIIALSMDVLVTDSNIMNDAIIKYEQKTKEEYSLEDILNIPLIKEARDGYKKLGKDPSRYRLACESLLRRLAKGNQLYRINNVVDVGNLLSIDANRSVAVLDYDKIQGDIKIRLGLETDVYEGIGRGIINVSNIPVYEDEVGPFGSTTSDTPRTMVTDNTKKILLFIICFSDTYIAEHRQKAIDLFTEYGYAKNIKELEVIKK